MTRIKADHWKELQGLIAFKILEIFHDRGDSQSKKSLQEELYKIYHGHPPSDTVSYASLAFEGQSPFQGLFETIAETSSGSNERHIPSSFTRDPSSNVIVGESFTLQLLKQSTLSTPRCVSGLSLWKRAGVILKNCKKAMAFAKEKQNSDGSLKSGLNADDLYIHVLDKMYEYLCNNAIDADNGEDEDENENDDGVNDASGVCPPTWYFCGFWTFQLFGPLAPLDVKSSLFNVESLDLLSQGRASIRANNAKNKKAAALSVSSSSAHAEAGTSPSGFKRGMGIREKSAVVHLAQQERMASVRNDELEFETISRSISVVKDELNFALNIVRQLDITDKDDPAWQNVFNLQKKFSEKSNELTDFQARKRQKKEEENKHGSIFDKFLQSVNTNYSMPPSPLMTVEMTSTFSSVSTDTSTDHASMSPAVNGLLNLADSAPNQED